MSLTLKEKELVNVGASVATGCKPCRDTNDAFNLMAVIGTEIAGRCLGTCLLTEINAARQLTHDEQIYAL